jgi:hypothetical protein
MVPEPIHGNQALHFQAPVATLIRPLPSARSLAPDRGGTVLDALRRITGDQGRAASVPPRIPGRFTVMGRTFWDTSTASAREPSVMGGLGGPGGRSGWSFGPVGDGPRRYAVLSPVSAGSSSPRLPMS